MRKTVMLRQVGLWEHFKGMLVLNMYSKNNVLFINIIFRDLRLNFQGLYTVICKDLGEHDGDVTVSAFAHLEKLLTC